mgnify:CR=1 FL=1
MTTRAETLACRETPDATSPLLSVVVVNWNTRDVLADCLGSIRQHLAGVAHETIVVDNGSSDGSPGMVTAEFPEMRLIALGENLGFGRASNLGMVAARGAWLLLLNSDARLVDASLLALVDALWQRPEAGVVGPRLVAENGHQQPSAHRFGSLARVAVEELGLYKLLPRRRAEDLLLGGYWTHGQERCVDWVTGACMLVRREVFERTGGFDPAIFLYGEDEEWCRRVRAAGWSVVFSPAATVVHAGHVTTHRFLGPADRIGRCLRAADDLVRREQGRIAAAAAAALRLTGAVLRLAFFAGRRLAGSDDARGCEARWLARTVLRHYGDGVRRACRRRRA